ncbi:ethanolamine utilization protein EutJ [Aestuariimicrobium sp. p3-SID1156]|uniref:ethanolamine utilization protein EutJ n=1 Tax=Aestuariimicrobium sp. p3-SID1156 TaxID=2916038 RepID=UPI00223C396B|nr:ethanolamine utilization protein EutJ [Aestuariimicrobium sp. p3-SID1156]MCT1458347.1 ethanolamine utilization protein EutJ [Aestuariimicrobium sp. p3-SID1156]
MSAPADRISRFAALVRTGEVERGSGPVRFGVDLGTANIVLSAVDEFGEPVAGGLVQSTVVRDGIVIDWQGAVHAVTSLKDGLFQRLGLEVTKASVAVPPGISAGTAKVFTNVLEAAGMETDEVVDEPVAAARVLGLLDGAVIDVGHGTTGVSILRDGKVAVSEDEPTGGHHMTLVVAGSLGISYEEAEKLKKNPGKRDMVLGLIRPTLEKMALIARDVLQGQDVEVVHLVGGSASHPKAEQVFAEVLGCTVIRPANPLFVTPLGIPMPATIPTPSEKRNRG